MGGSFGPTSLSLGINDSMTGGKTQSARDGYLTAFGGFCRPPWEGLFCKPEKTLAQAQQEHSFCVRHGVCVKHGFCAKTICGRRFWSKNIGFVQTTVLNSLDLNLMHKPGFLEKAILKKGFWERPYWQKNEKGRTCVKCVRRKKPMG